MTTKIAVSLPDELVADARARVARGEFASMSACVADALRRFGRQDSLDKLLADMDEEFGPVSPEAEKWAEAAIDKLDP